MQESQEHKENRLNLAKKLFTELLNKGEEYPKKVKKELNMDLQLCEEELENINVYAKMWSHNSKPKGELIGESYYNKLVNKKEEYEIFVIDRGEFERDSVGIIYFSYSENPSNKKNSSKKQKIKTVNVSLKHKEYKLLVFTLKNKLIAGDMITIIQDCFNEPGKAKRLDANLKDDKIIGKGKNWFHEETSHYRKEIGNLSKVLTHYLDVELSSQRTGNFKLARNVKYCLIEIIFN